MSYDRTIREEIENRIRKKLEEPNLSADDLETLCRAYSELTKNDWMNWLEQKKSLIPPWSPFKSNAGKIVPFPHVEQPSADNKSRIDYQALSDAGFPWAPFKSNSGLPCSEEDE